LKWFELDLNSFELEFELDLLTSPCTVAQGPPVSDPPPSPISTLIRTPWPGWCRPTTACRSGRGPPLTRATAWCPLPPSPPPLPHPASTLKSRWRPPRQNFSPSPRFSPDWTLARHPPPPPLHCVQSWPPEACHLAGITRNAIATSASR
jgi:hypothetical protein